MATKRQMSGGYSDMMDMSVPQTAWEYMVDKVLPGITQRVNETTGLIPSLIDLPWRRRPNLRRDSPVGFKTGRDEGNVAAMAIQVGGIACRHKCQNCSSGRGIWQICVVPPSTHTKITKGACANCFYNKRGSGCSFRHQYEDQQARESAAAGKREEARVWDVDADEDGENGENATTGGVTRADTGSNYAPSSAKLGVYTDATEAETVASSPQPTHQTISSDSSQRSVSTPRSPSKGERRLAISLDNTLHDDTAWDTSSHINPAPSQTQSIYEVDEDTWNTTLVPASEIPKKRKSPEAYDLYEEEEEYTWQTSPALASEVPQKGRSSQTHNPYERDRSYMRILSFPESAGAKKRKINESEDNKLEDNKLEDDRFEDDRFEDNKFEDDRFEDDRFEDDRVEDNKFEDNRFEDNKFEDVNEAGDVEEFEQVNKTGDDEFEGVDKTGDVDEAEVDKSEVDKSEVDKSEVDKSEVDKSEVVDETEAVGNTEDVDGIQDFDETLYEVETLDKVEKGKEAQGRGTILASSLAGDSRNRQIEANIEFVKCLLPQRWVTEGLIDMILRLGASTRPISTEILTVSPQIVSDKRDRLPPAMRRLATTADTRKPVILSAMITGKHWTLGMLDMGNRVRLYEGDTGGSGGGSNESSPRPLMYDSCPSMKPVPWTETYLRDLSNVICSSQQPSPTRKVQQIPGFEQNNTWDCGVAVIVAGLHVICGIVLPKQTCLDTWRIFISAVAQKRLSLKGPTTILPDRVVTVLKTWDESRLCPQLVSVAGLSSRGVLRLGPDYIEELKEAHTIYSEWLEGMALLSDVQQSLRHIEAVLVRLTDDKEIRQMRDEKAQLEEMLQMSSKLCTVNAEVEASLQKSLEWATRCCDAASGALEIWEWAKAMIRADMRACGSNLPSAHVNRLTPPNANEAKT